MTKKAEIGFDEYLNDYCRRYGYENSQPAADEVEHVRREYRALTNYAKRVARLNYWADASYRADIHFVTFRITKRGIKVGYTCGKPEEVRALRLAVATANANLGNEEYYMED